MFDQMFASHPVLTVLAASVLMGFIGWFEYSVANSRRGAYLTWGLAGLGLVGFFVRRLLS